MRVASVAVCFVLGFSLCLSASSRALPAKVALKPFSTDGCSVWIDGPPKSPYLWRHCCVAHDRDYWQGGSEAARIQSDKNLRQCIADLAGPAMANYMYFFVTTGGSPMWLTPYRWGYGWGYLDAGKPRGYKLLTAEEQAEIDALAADADQVARDDALRHPADAKTLLLK